MEAYGTFCLRRWYSLFLSSVECAHAIDLAVLCLSLGNELLLQVQSCFMHRQLIQVQGSPNHALLVCFKGRLIPLEVLYTGTHVSQLIYQLPIY